MDVKMFKDFVVDDEGKIINLLIGLFICSS